MSALRTITVEGRTAQEAQEAALIWVRGEPGIRLRRISRVRPHVNEGGNAWPEHWDVELVYVSVDPGFGLA